MQKLRWHSFAILAVFAAIMVFALLPQEAAKAIPPGTCNNETLIYNQNFNGGASGWSHTAVQGSPATWAWLPLTGYGGSLGSWLGAGTNNIAISRLVGPSISIPAGVSEIFLRFQHSYQLQGQILDPSLGRDGGQVQISVNGGAYTTILNSAFTQNGYTRMISDATSPIDGQLAFSGTQATYHESIVNLSSSVTGGQSLNLGFAVATNTSVVSIGWRIGQVQVGYCVIAPTITSTNTTTFTEGSAGTFTVTASGSTPITFSLSGAPAWLSIDTSTGALSGTPPAGSAATGSFTFDVVADNAAPGNATQNFTLNVAAVPPAFTSLNNTTFVEGSAGTFNVTASGSTPITFSLSGAPAWLSIDSSTGVLSGTPPAGSAATGSFMFDIVADNPAPGTVTQNFTLFINDVPTITSTDSVTVTNGSAFIHTFMATGNPIPTLSYVVGTLPSGVSLVGDVLSGTPAGPGVYTIDVTATNGVTPDATQTFTLTVQGGAPLITSVATLHMEQESYIAHTFAATGNPDPTVTYTDVNLPPGLTLTGDTISGYAHLSGTYGVTVTATNGVAPDAVQHFVLIVGALPEPPPLPFAEDVNFLETTAVRTGVPSNVFDTILVRIMYQYGSPTQWLGGDMYNLGNIGIQGVVDMGVWQAIDLSGANGATYFEGGATFCLHGEGTLIWMSAANTPRVAEIIGSYTVPEFPGYTCATLFEPGTLVLVNGNAG